MDRHKTDLQRADGSLNPGGFAFEVQLSITEKGQYAVAYGLSCKKDCHELHTTDPRRTIPYPIPVPPLHHRRNRQTAQPPQKHHQPRNQAALHPRTAIQRRKSTEAKPADQTNSTGENPISSIRSWFNTSTPLYAANSVPNKYAPTCINTTGSHSITAPFTATSAKTKATAALCGNTSEYAANPPARE